MIKKLLLIPILFLTLIARGQNADQHYIKFLHVGERILPVHTLNISFGYDDVPRDSVEIINDTLRVVSIVTDSVSYNTISDYVHHAKFRLSKSAGKLEFGTFKIIRDGKYYYVPDVSCTDYFKKLVKRLQKSHADPLLIKAIMDNYTWIFTP